MGDKHPQCLQWRHGREEVIALVECYFLGHIPAPNIRVLGIPLVHVYPASPERPFSGGTPALLQGDLLPDFPVQHEVDLLLPRGLHQGRRQLISRNTVEDCLLSPGLKVVRLVDQLIVTSSHLGNDTVRLGAQTVERAASLELLLDFLRNHLALLLVLRLNPLEDRTTQLRRIYCGSTGSPTDQMLVCMSPSTFPAEPLQDLRGRAHKPGLLPGRHPFSIGTLCSHAVLAQVTHHRRHSQPLQQPTHAWLSPGGCTRWVLVEEVPIPTELELIDLDREVE